jgi:imidazolonepropionase-like amidohydrolase
MNRTRRRIIIPTLAALAAMVLSLGAADDRALVIRDAKVHTLSADGTLERASIVIVDGKITDVGPKVKVPSGARSIRARGLEVFPGMINAWSNIGLTEVGSVEVTNDSREMGEFTPQLLAFSAVHPASEHIPVARVNGITASLSAPSGGVIAGQAVLLHLDGWTADEMAILKSAGMVMSFPSLGGGGGRRSRRAPQQSRSFNEIKRANDKKVAEIAELFARARHYAKAREANPATAINLELEALIGVVRGEMTVFIQANSARDIQNAVEFAKKEGLKFVIVGGREADQAAEILKEENVPVLLDAIIALPSRRDDPYDSRFTLPRDLAEAGVKFALTLPSSSNVRNLPYEAGFAVAYGLPYEEALKSVTLYPAEILGVADKLGSIEPGKIADLVITDGDILEVRTQIKHLIIAGKEVSLSTKHTELYQKYLKRP